MEEQTRMAPPPPSQSANDSTLDEDTQFYDPDQDIEERRAVRKGFRDLTRQLNGMKYIERTSGVMLTHGHIIQAPERSTWPLGTGG